MISTVKINNLIAVLIVLCGVSCKTEISVVAETDNVFKNSTYTAVKYKLSPTGSWTTSQSNHTLIVDNIRDLNKTVVAEDSWGGKAGDYSSNVKFGTPGFFRVGKVGPRWVFINPDNGMDIIHGTQDVSPGTGSDFNNLFANNAAWSVETGNLLIQNGLNCISTSTVSDIKSNLLNPGLKKMAYTEILYMVQRYAWRKYPNWFKQNVDNPLCLMWESKYLQYVDSVAKAECALVKDDVYFLGYQLDNELGFYSTNATPGVYGIDINAFMAFAPTTSTYIFANNFLKQRGVTISTVTSADNEAFRDSVVNYFYRVTTAAIRKYDPNHLILGSRLNGLSMSDEVTLRACAKYCDVVSVNYYGHWDPDPVYMDNLRKFTNDKPFMVTEFYIKADSAYYNSVKFDNLDGGGWIVETQKDRGCFYQNFCIKLLKAQNCVGWLHFKYGDALSTRSPRYTNKGIISPKYEPYINFLKYVKQLNTNVYNIADYIDK